MQGRMLGWIKGFYDVKQLETEKPKRAEKHKEMMEVIREVRDSYLSDIRTEVAAIHDDAQRLQHFLYVDDLISFAIILKVVEELRALYQSETFARLNKLTQDGCVASYYADEVSESIKQFDIFLNANNLDTLTLDNINEFVRTQRRTLSANLASTFNFDFDELSEEFKRDVESDIALSYIQHIIKQSDMRQTAGMAAITKEFFWLTTSKILNPYISLPHLITCLEPHVEIVDLYRELNVWMKGIHFYHASLLKRELDLKKVEYGVTGDGVILLLGDKPYPPMNSIVDKAMQFKFGLTFYDLARYVHDAAQVLASRLLTVKTEENAAKHAVTDSSASALQHSGLFAASSAAAAAAAATVTIAAPDPDSADDLRAQFNLD